MKILVDGLPNSFGGVGSLIMNIVECSKRRGDENEFYFLVNRESEYRRLVERWGYEVCYVPKLSNVAEYYSKVKRLIFSKKFDLLWINNTSKVNIVLPYLAKRYGNIKIVTHSHGTACEETGLKRYIFRAIEAVNTKKYFELIDLPLACGKEAGEYFYRGYCHKDKVKTIKNGIVAEKYRYDSEFRCKIREELNIDKDTIALCSVGRLVPVKNYSFLIELMKRLPLEYQMYILGEGPEKDSLHKTIMKYGLKNRVFLIGYKENANEFLSGMDIFVMPSISEGMPFSLIEAQANGLSCVVSDTISNETALSDKVVFANINSVEEWKKAVVESKYNINRTEGLAKVKKHGFDIEQSYDELIEMFLNVLNQKND